MTLDSAIQKATLFYSLIGAKVMHDKKKKVKIITRITAYKKELNKWDVAVFFDPNNKKEFDKPDCFLSKFIKEYEIISKT